MGRGRTILAACAFLLAGCGGGGGGGDDPLAALQGHWFGQTVHGTTTLEIGAAGVVTQMLEDGIDNGLTGTLQHVSGTYYEGVLSNTAAIRLFLDPSGAYATYYSDFTVGALQKGATTLPAGGFQVADVAPDQWQGTSFTIGGDLHLVARFAATTTIAADGSHSGSDGSGLTYGSPPATMLAPALQGLSGPYADSAHATTGFIDVLPSPDMLFLAVASFPVTNTLTANAAFMGAWRR